MGINGTNSFKSGIYIFQTADGQGGSRSPPWYTLVELDKAKIRYVNGRLFPLFYRSLLIVTCDSS